MFIKGLDKACIAIPAESELLQSGALNEMSCRKKWKEDLYGKSVLIFEPNVHAFKFLKNLFPEATYDTKAEEHREKCRASLRAGMALIAAKQQDVSTMSDADFSQLYKTQPFDHQKKALLLSYKEPNYALFMEQGTGKTKVTIDTAAYQHEAQLIQALVIVTLNGVHWNWVLEEIPKHLSDKIQTEIAVWSATPTVPRRKALERLLSREYSGKLKVLAMNIDAVTTEKGRRYLEEFLAKFPSLFVMDEGLLIKSPSAGRTKAMKGLGRLAPFKRLLNGTPITQGMEDLYSQFGFLSESILGFSSFYTFKNEHCVMSKNQTRTGQKYELISGYKNTDSLLKRVEAYSYRVTKDECLDLPERLYRKRYVEIDSEQRKFYESVKNDIIVKIDSQHELTVDNVLSEVLRLRQIIGGFLPTDDGKLIKLGEITPKLKMLKEELALNKTFQTMIWATFTAEVNMIADMLGVPSYQGTTSNDDREKMKKEFQAGHLQHFVAISPNQPSGAAMGLTLTNARQVYHYGNGYSYAMRCQMDDRAHRIGQKNKVIYTDIVAIDTVDEAIIKALLSKRNVAAAVTKDQIKAWL